MVVDASGAGIFVGALGTVIDINVAGGALR